MNCFINSTLTNEFCKTAIQNLFTFIKKINRIMAKIGQEETKQGFALAKENYKLLVIGFAIIVLGFILMVGGKSNDPNVFNPEIFNFRRITLAPMIVLFGKQRKRERR
eukprot:TRINITY_DN42533_c0_g1_i1.p4 TRINITY_DN42533_c0_g1~~TRINITY_DN42533_c0_g1_i1.p4  ORF type:complete len:108 (+),score=3.71 TRINITY_DN42533_c0_g1_i1:277-600(+)